MALFRLALGCCSFTQVTAPLQYPHPDKALRRRFLNDPVISALQSRLRGPKTGSRRLDPAANQIISEVICDWLPRQRQLAHPSTDLFLEIGRRCASSDVACPSRQTTARRWKKQLEEDALKRAALPNAQLAPGNFLVKRALEVVQVGHTQADVLVVDEVERKVLGRPWLSLALDVALRCVLGFYVAMERPSAATVGLLLTRAVLPKGPWLEMLEVDASWPMRGIPHVLHLDNAAEFKSKALRKGCREYGIELMYRPVGRPHFGGHIERLNRTLMERVRGLPGATGSSTKGRKARKSETTAALTLREFERWMVLEIAKRYHWSPHRGLLGATPGDSWRILEYGGEGRRPPQTPDAALQFLIRFLPVVSRTIQPDGLTLFRIRCWHPIFSAWKESRRTVTVRYHPEGHCQLAEHGTAQGRERVPVRNQ